MPKLYHHAEGWQVPGRQDKKAIRVDVPSTPPELAAWLNARRVPLEGDAFDGLVPCNTAADELIGSLRAQPSEHAGDAAAYILGPSTKDPPRLSPAFLGDLAAGAEFVPISKTAEIDRLLARCPACHQSAEGALALQQGKEIEAIFAWAAAAPEWAVLQLASRLAELAEEIKERNVQ
jgi:hypothetical protein